MHIASLDIEATRSGENQIIEIGILFMDNDVEVGRFNTLIDPQVPLTHLNNSISSITDDMVQGKSRIDQVLPNLLEALRG